LDPDLKGEIRMFELFSFWGRIGCARYWGLSGVCVVIFIASSIAVALTANATNAAPVNVIAVGVALAGLLICWAMGMALAGIGVRRLHDRGRSGFWILLYYSVVPVVPLGLFGPESFGALGTAVIGLAAAIMLWSVIDLGLLPGKPADDPDGAVAGAA
jgi:uncharacterized membrane protein YhaH (DUF805 family)